MRLTELGKLEHFNYLIGNRTRDLPACSIVPQPSTLPRASSVAKSSSSVLHRNIFD
jgi:hypothetical protein